MHYLQALYRVWMRPYNSVERNLTVPTKGIVCVVAWLKCVHGPCVYVCRFAFCHCVEAGSLCPLSGGVFPFLVHLVTSPSGKPLGHFALQMYFL